MDVQSFLREENEEVARLSERVAHAVWMVNTTGEKKWQEAEVEAEREYRRHFADRKRFERIAELREKVPEGSLERRQLDRLYQEALENQVPAELLDEMIRLSSELSNIFNTFRGTVDGRKVTENQVRNVLAESTDSEEREKVWRASKQIGREVEKGLIRLVKLRNEAARRLGFENHHQMKF
ncbi:MAG: M2 family metallopeptidase, partial [Planifilum fulgidum]